jgi:hypothetical protein
MSEGPNDEKLSQSSEKKLPAAGSSYTGAQAKPLSGQLPASATPETMGKTEIPASDEDWGWLRERVMKSTAEPDASDAGQAWVPPILFDPTEEESVQAAAAALSEEPAPSVADPSSTETPQADTGPLRDFIAGLLRISDDKKSPLEEGEVTDDLVAERLNRSLGMLPPDEMSALSTADGEAQKDSTGYVAPFSDWLGEPPSDSQPFPRVVGEDFIEPEEPEIAQFEQFLNWTPENTLQEEKRLDLPLDEAVFQTGSLRMPFEDLPKTAQLSQERKLTSAASDAVSNPPADLSAEPPVSDPVSDIREIALQGYREEEKKEPPSVQLPHKAKKTGKAKNSQNAYPTAKASVNWKTWLGQRSGIEKLLLVEGLLVAVALAFAIPFFIYMVIYGLM